MSEKEFLIKMADVIDTEELLSMDMNLDAIAEWDSLSYVSFMAMAVESSKKRITPQSVREAKTMRDLYKLL